jgi:hypothetical protein
MIPCRVSYYRCLYRGKYIMHQIVRNIFQYVKFPSIMKMLFIHIQSLFSNNKTTNHVK